ncbi:MAG: beta-CASP ribonuclease aCPSF1, partial [Nitrososphaerota archaeon]|nr:beta-CASP ribonuclease aCPSF1 [Nitrososphaerota archaeon]
GSANYDRGAADLLKTAERHDAHLSFLCKPRPEDILADLPKELGTFASALAQDIVHVLNALTWDVRKLSYSDLPTCLVSNLDWIEPFFDRKLQGFSSFQNCFAERRVKEYLLDARIRWNACQDDILRFLFILTDRADIELDELDAVIISHAHLDHTGFLPALYKYGYDGPVYCTEPTLPLMTLLQGDMVKIGQLEGGRLVYDQRDIREVIKHAITVPYGLVTDVAPDVKLVFNNAGHILGSATVHLHIGEGAHNIVYTGDYKYGKTQLLESAFWNYPRVETLITESTYGTKEDVVPSREEVELLFTKYANDTLREGGKVLIPVPAVGRSQEIMLVIDHYMREKKLVETPVFIEGMISEATAIHIAYPEYLSRELKYKILEEDSNPFSSEFFTVIEHPSNREEALREGGAIIMATSGMLEGGPVIEYFSQLAGSDKNRVMFVSYQVQGTMGRRVLDGSRQVSLLGENGKIKVIDVNCQVNKIEGLSGHSDYNQIVNFVRKLRPKLQQIFVNHGEKRKCETLSYNLSRMFKLPVYHPQVEETIRIR